MARAEPGMSERPDIIAWAAMGLLILCFGSSFFWFALVLTQFDGWVTGAARFVVAGAALPLICFAAGIGLPKGRVEWLWCAAYGLVGFVVPFYLVAHAQTVVPSNVVVIFGAVIPLLVLGMSWFFLSVRITGRKWLGCAVGSGGLILMAVPGLESQIGGGAVLASIGLLIATVFIAGGAVLIRIMPTMHPVKTAAGAAIVGALVSLPVLGLTYDGEMPTTRAMVGILAGGLFTTALGQILRVFLIRRKGPVFLTPVGYLTPFVGGALGVGWLGESFTTETAIAFAIILAGVAIAQDGSGSMKQR